MGLKLVTLPALLSALLSLSACDNGAVPVDTSRMADSSEPEQHKNNGTYYFGFDVRRGPQEDARQYLPLLAYLEKETGYRFSLKFTPKDKSTAQMLGENKVHFAALGATSYIKARAQYPVVSLVRGLNQQGQSRYRSFIVARPGSDIKQLEDIRGKKLAFGDRDSTQGHLIPRIMLLEHNIGLGDLRSHIYTTSHRHCAEAVISNKTDVCGMQDTLAREMVEQGLLRIIHESAYYPSSGVAANQQVPETVRHKVRDALTRFKPQGQHRQGLYNWQLTEMPLGFEAAYEKDYATLENWMLRLGMVK